MIGPLLFAISTVPSAGPPVAALVHARDLLLARKYVVLTRLVEDQQRAAAANPAKEDELDWTLNAFRLTNAGVPRLINDWAAASPKSWAPLLARAVNGAVQAGLARGERWASETSADQFRQMAELNAAVRADCRRVLALNRNVCPCYRELVIAAKNDDANPAQLLKEAFGTCPRDYSLHVEYVFGLTPRWGGSYEQMGLAIESARKAGLDEAQVRSLEGYLPIDKASRLLIARRLDEARKVLDQAIDRSPTAILFEERAELNYQRQDAPGALADANAALEKSQGGWMFSAGRLTRLLIARAWAFYSLGRFEEARTDVGWAIEISPTDEQVKKWQVFVGTLPGPVKN